MTIIVTTNNVPRDLLQWDELTDKERDWYLDLLDTPEDYHYLRYRGSVHLFEDFVRIERMGERTNSFTITAPEGSPLLHWDGAMSDSYWSGIVVRFAIGDDGSSTDTERIVVGRYYEGDSE